MSDKVGTTALSLNSIVFSSVCSVLGSAGMVLVFTLVIDLSLVLVWFCGGLWLVYSNWFLLFDIE